MKKLFLEQFKKTMVLLLFIGFLISIFFFKAIEKKTPSSEFSTRQESAQEGVLGDAFVGPIFFRISSQSLTITNTARDFFIGTGTASQSSGTEFGVDNGNQWINFNGQNYRFPSNVGSNGQVLKTDGGSPFGTLSWSADSTGSAASDSLNFDEFQNPLVLDTGILTTSGSYAWGFGGVNLYNLGSLVTGTGDEGIFGGQLQVAGTASVGYSRFGTNATGHSLSATRDLLITGLLEVDSQAYIDASASVSSDFEVVGYASASDYFGIGEINLTGPSSNSFSGSLNVSKGLNANSYQGAGLSSCFASGKVLRYNSGQFSCGTLADGDIPDAITVSGGTIGSNNISGTLTTTGTLTIGDNGDAIVLDASNWDISSAGQANFNAVASHSFGGSVEPVTSGTGALGTTAKKWSQAVANLVHAVVQLLVGNLSISGNTISSTTGGITISPNNSTTNISGAASVSTNFEVGGYASVSDTGFLKLPTRSSFTFYQLGQSIFDTTNFELQVASTSQNTPVVVPTLQKLWAASIASTSNEFFNGGRIRLPTQDSKFKLVKVYCGTKGGTSVVINVSNMGGNYDSETITCTPGGASDTSIGTSADFSIFTVPSASLEIGAITGTYDAVDWLDFSIYGYLKPQ